jgi:hypothetical protein
MRFRGKGCINLWDSRRYLGGVLLNSRYVLNSSITKTVLASIETKRPSTAKSSLATRNMEIGIHSFKQVRALVSNCPNIFGRFPEADLTGRVFGRGLARHSRPVHDQRFSHCSRW